MRLVAVGSTNPSKITATKRAFESLWPEATWEVKGVSVPSMVSDQPMSDAEAIAGAETRARGALEALGADFGVGLEGGIQQIGARWFDCGWIAVVDSQGTVGVGSSARVIVPRKMMQKIQAGVELGLVVDEFFGTNNARQAEGHFGLMTNQTVTRISGYRDGVLMALARFITPSIFEHGE